MQELAKGYEPAKVEDRLYAQWLADKNFHADETSSKPPFSIVIPPPNVTGRLTMGHVLNNTLQDILCRKARLEGKEVLWLPGTDHAGLATQSRVERHLRETEKKNRHDLGRQEFLKRTWSWTKEHGGIIIQQLKKLGCSCDWDRERFTLDPAYERAVQDIFVELFQRGYIYRGQRMVNWDPASLTAISDEEVIPTAQKSTLYTMRYEVIEKPGVFLEISTTRPETLMGDTGVAVNPSDERYREYIGLHCRRPFPEAPIPIVADEHVDLKFGTGVLKVTPAHDKADFEIGQRHNLPIIDVLTANAKINCPAVPELHGLDRFAARTKAAEMLRERGLMVKEEPYENNVGFSERGNVPIEPRLSLQWFLKYPKTAEALQVVRDGTIRFFPSHWAKTYDHWLTNIQDWCISRQVWWGHRIPVWYKGDEVKSQVECPGEGWEQDPDTLDTWASSWLWAYETMDHPTRAKFYPTSVLVTGPDIIFLWVARMIIAGLEIRPGKTEAVEDNIAFKDVYFTGIVRDKNGKKMSKNLGNSPDPLDLIAKYGADGLRFGIMRIAPLGSDIRFDEKQIEEGRNFCNKLWNACRFRTMFGPIDSQADPSLHLDALSPFDRQILRRFAGILGPIHTAYEKYAFSEVASLLYDFVWNDFCSRYVEAAKHVLATADAPARAATLATMDHILSDVLILLHPYAPFITEELWLSLGFGVSTIQFATWPAQEADVKRVAGPLAQTDAEAEFADAVYATVDAGRNLRGESKLPASQRVKFQLLPKPEVDLRASEAVISALLNAESLELLITAPADAKGTPVAFTPLGELYLPLAGLIDPEVEKQRLEKELAKVRKDLEQTRKKLDNADMLAKAPAQKVTEWRDLAIALAEKERRLMEQVGG